MNLSELFITEDNRHCSFCFGRFNPPNAGHAVVFDTVEKAADGGDWFIFTSKSNDPKKNPLTYEQKVSWLYRLHPNLKKHLIEDPSIKTYLQAAVYLYNKGYRSATFVAGKEDMPAMQGPLEQYNGVESKHGMYDFKPLRFVVSPSPEGRSTDARNFAVQGNLKGFQQITGIQDPKTAQELMNDVRQGMNVKETVDGGSPEASKRGVIDRPGTYIDQNGFRQFENMLPAKAFAGSDKNKLGSAGQWRNKGPKKNKPAKAGDFVGGEGVEEGYGRYWCSTDKKWKTRQGPKQDRKTSEAANAAQQAAIAIAKKKKKGTSETMAGVGMLDNPERNAVANEVKQRLDPKCWKGYRKAGTKMKGGKRVNNCVPVGEDVENVIGSLIAILESK
jgi:hypothetical protein